MESFLPFFVTSLIQSRPRNELEDQDQSFIWVYFCVFSVLRRILPVADKTGLGATFALHNFYQFDNNIHLQQILCSINIVQIKIFFTS